MGALKQPLVNRQRPHFGVFAKGSNNRFEAASLYFPKINAKVFS